MIVKRINYNWHPVSDGETSGEDFSWFEVGSRGVVSITENPPCNGLQMWNFVIEFDDGTKRRVFNPNMIFYLPDHGSE